MEFEPPTTPHIVHGPNIYIVLVVLFYGLALLACAFKLTTRLMKPSLFGADDILLLICLILSGILYGLMFKYYHTYGNGNVALMNLTTPGLISIRKYSFISRLVYVASFSFAQLSLLALYYRLIRRTSHPWLRRCLDISTAFTAISSVITIIISLTMCIPTNRYWSFPFPSLKGGPGCRAENTIDITTTVLSLVCQILITILPIPVLRQLSLSPRQNYGLYFLCFLSLLVIIAAVARAVIVTYNVFVPSFQLKSYQMQLLVSITFCLCLICAAAPSFPLFIKMTAKHRRAIKRRLSFSNWRKKGGVGIDSKVTQTMHSSIMSSSSCYPLVHPSRATTLPQNQPNWQTSTLVEKDPNTKMTGSRISAFLTRTFGWGNGRESKQLPSTALASRRLHDEEANLPVRLSLLEDQPVAISIPPPTLSPKS